MPASRPRSCFPDEGEEVDSKNTEKPDDVKSENIEQKSKTDNQVNATPTNLNDKDSISDVNEKQQKASRIDENKQNTEEQDIKSESQNESKIENKKDSSPEVSNNEKDVEK